MSLTLHYHPLSSFCHKVLIGLYELEVAFEKHLVDLGDEASRAAFVKLWPLGEGADQDRLRHRQRAASREPLGRRGLVQHRRLRCCAGPVLCEQGGSLRRRAPPYHGVLRAHLRAPVVRARARGGEALPVHVPYLTRRSQRAGIPVLSNLRSLSILRSTTCLRGSVEGFAVIDVSRTSRGEWSSARWLHCHLGNLDLLDNQER